MIALPTVATASASARSPDETADGVVWFRAARVDVFPRDGGACVLAGPLQIAVFNFARRGEWYACQNLCPHRMQMALSRGLLGSADGVAKIACPFHKTTFSLETGECLGSSSGAHYAPIRVYPVLVEDGWVHIGLPAGASG